MEKKRAYRLARHLRLVELLTEAGGPKGLQAATGATDTHLTACAKGRREIGDDLAASLEEGMEKPEGWMDTHPKVPIPGIPSDALALAYEFDRLSGDTRARVFARLLNGIAAAAAEDAALGLQTAPSASPTRPPVPAHRDR